ncbi:hypothetical protein L1887_56477 [Cichorium endivia]|nr:hypothetical protein L1887_56477 [Cichorium endivia]
MRLRPPLLGRLPERVLLAQVDAADGVAHVVGLDVLLGALLALAVLLGLRLGSTQRLVEHVDRRRSAAAQLEVERRSALLQLHTRRLGTAGKQLHRIHAEVDQRVGGRRDDGGCGRSHDGSVGREACRLVQIRERIASGRSCAGLGIGLGEVEQHVLELLVGTRGVVFCRLGTCNHARRRIRGRRKLRPAKVEERPHSHAGARDALKVVDALCVDDAHLEHVEHLPVKHADPG